MKDQTNEITPDEQQFIDYAVGYFGIDEKTIYKIGIHASQWVECATSYAKWYNQLKTTTK